MFLRPLKDDLDDVAVSSLQIHACIDLAGECTIGCSRDGRNVLAIKIDEDVLVSDTILIDGVNIVQTT